MSSSLKEKAAIARNLRHHRKRQGWTQEQLSENSGVATRTIQRIENAKVEPHLQTLVLLAGSLELEISDLSAMAPAEDVDPGGAVIRKWLLMFHLSPVVGFIIPFANLIIPLILWAYKREDHPLYDEHGRAVINFHLTASLAFMVGVALLLVLFPAGIILIVLTSGYVLVLILFNVQRVMKNANFRYPLSLKLL